MIRLPSSLIIGAATRNAGKTTFICSLLERFQPYQPIAVKIKTLYPGDHQWHGKGAFLDDEYIIRQEEASGGLEDSKKMLDAGADQVFYVKAQYPFLARAFSDLLKKLDPGRPLLIESNSVRDVILPGVFLMIKKQQNDEMKPSAARLIHLADRIVATDGARHDPAPSEIELEWRDNTWLLSV